MSSYAFTALFNAAVALAFGLWVYIMNPRHSARRRWIILTITISVWSFGQFMRDMSLGDEAARFWGVYVLYLGASLIPATFLHFIVDFMSFPSSLRRRLMGAVYGAAAILLGLIYFTDLIIKGMVENPFFRHYVDPGRFYFLFLAYFGGVFILALTILAVGIHRSSGLRKDQLRIILAASLISFIGGSTTFLPILHVGIFPFGNYFVSLYAFLISYGVFRHQLMDIDVFLRKSISAVIVIFSFIIPLFILLVLAQNFLFGRADPLFTILVLLSMVVAATTFPRFRMKAEESVEHFLNPSRRDDRRTVARLSEEAVSILDLQRLLRSLVDTLSLHFRCPSVAILVLEEKRGRYNVLESVGYDETFKNNLHLSLNEPLVSHFQSNPATLYREIAVPEAAGDAQPPPGVFDRFRAELIIPLVVKNRLVGLILMGKKENGRPYSLDDLEILRTLANQAAIAIENARLYEDLKKSKQYMRRADRLASLGTLAAGLAHEIRNPLVSIKTFIQLLPQRLDDTDFRTNFLSIANDEVERIRRLVEELLNFARPSEPNLQRAELNDIIEKILLLVENDMRHKEIEVIKGLAPGIPALLMDKEQVKQVILNIVINAVQAIGSRGQIRIDTRTMGIGGEKPSVQVEIHDNGPGIPEEDLEHIFNPFFTTKHMGSGLGLAISHQIIKEHQGSIEVESSPERGTSFFINLPLDPRRHERRKTKGE